MTEQMNVPKLRFSEFDTPWKPIPLGEITSYLKGFAFKSEDYLNTGQADSRLIRVSDLSSASLKLDNQKVFLPPELMASSTRYKLKDDDVLITTVGSKPELRESAVGRAIYINKAHGYLNQNLLIMRTKDEQSPKFIFSQLNTPRYINHITNIQRGNANQSNITVVDLFEYRVSTTSLSEQQKIASFLSKVDEKITLLTEKKDKLTEYKKGVMQQLFNGKWQEKDSQLNFIPPTLRFKADDGSAFPDWEEKKLGKAVSIKSSKVIPYEGFDLPCIELDNLSSNTGEIIGDISVNGALSQKNRFKSGDVLFGKLRPYLRKFAHPHFAGICSSEIWVMSVTKELSSNYLFQFVQTEAFISETNKSSGTKMPRADWKVVSQMAFSLPHIKEQLKIAGFLSAIDQKIDLVSSELEKAKEWKKGLLQQMFV